MHVNSQHWYIVLNGVLLFSASHRGPGGGCSSNCQRFFDPLTYRIILFDQRGAGRSKPLGKLEVSDTV